MRFLLAEMVLDILVRMIFIRNIFFFSMNTNERCLYLSPNLSSWPSISSVTLRMSTSPSSRFFTCKIRLLSWISFSGSILGNIVSEEINGDNIFKRGNRGQIRLEMVTLNNIKHISFLGALVC